MIKEILNNLKEEQRRQIMYAFENDIGQCIEFEPGRFIGVNVTNPIFKIIEQQNKFVYGES